MDLINILFARALNKEDATKEYVNEAIKALKGEVSADLDTLEELSKALGNDPDFFLTIKNEIDGFKTELVTNKDAATENTRFAIGVAEQNLEVPSMEEFNQLKDEIANLDSVLYTPQMLTDDQQAQVRVNIGAADADGLTAAEEGTSVLREKPELQPVYQAADYHQESGIREFYYDADRDCLIAKYDNPTTGGEIATSATANMAGITSENGIFECAGKVIRLEYEIDVQDDAEPYFAIRIYAAADGSGSSYRLTRALDKDKNSLLYDIEAEIAAFGKDPSVFKYYYFEGVSSNVFVSSRRNYVRLYYYGEYSPEQMDAGINLKEKVRKIADALPGKLSEPAEGLAVGKYFRVAAIDENGHAVLEAVDAKDVGVQDVQVAGASVVEGGVANVPIAGSAGNYGVIRGDIDYGYYIAGGAFACGNYTAEQLSSKINNSFIGKGSLFNLLSTPSKMPALTADEQAAARERMGISGDYELIEEITLEEAVNAIERSTEPDGTAYNFSNMFVKTYTPGGAESATMNVRYYTTQGTSIIAYIPFAVDTGDRYGMSKVETKYGYLEAYGCIAGSTINTAILNLTGTTYSEYMSRRGSITKLVLNLQDGKLLPVGSKIEIYGVRA